MAEDISIEELLSELRRLDKSSDDGYTFRELQNKLGVSKVRVHRMISTGLERKIITPGRAERKSIDGSLRPVPVYRFVHEKSNE